MVYLTEEIEPSDVLKRAAEDAGAAFAYNRDREAGIRPSRAGLPLIQLVLEDIVLPKLVTPVERKRTFVRDPLAKVMSLSIGHLYEKAVESQLLQQYSGTSTEVKTQEVINLGDMQGSCDILLIDHQHQWAKVIECKALKGYSVAEVKEQKLLCDNWGYFTQLAVYVLSISQKYPSYNVTGCWHVWIKQLEKQVIQSFPLTQEEMLVLYSEIQEKAKQYQEFKQLFAQGKLSYAVGQLIKNTEDLPRKFEYNSYLAGSCGFHFNAHADLLTKRDGTLVDNAEDMMLLLARAAYYGNESEHQQEITKLLSN